MEESPSVSEPPEHCVYCGEETDFTCDDCHNPICCDHYEFNGDWTVCLDCDGLLELPDTTQTQLEVVK